MRYFVVHADNPHANTANEQGNVAQGGVLMEAPRKVSGPDFQALNRLAGLGFRVVATAADAYDTIHRYAWTLEKILNTSDVTTQHAKITYLIISTCNLDAGQTVVGNKHADVGLMQRLCAQYESHLTSPDVYVVNAGVQNILNALADLGYRVIGNSAGGLTFVWTLEKTSSEVSESEETNSQRRAFVSQRSSPGDDSHLY